jgi:O-antigen/teichoic acid export membrane protein
VTPPPTGRGTALGTFISHSVHTIGLSAVATLASVAIAIVTARSLGPAGRGAVALLILIPVFVVTFARLGIGHAINYHAGRWPREQLISSVLALTLIMGVSATVLALPVVLLVRDLVFQGIPLSFVWLACGVIPMALAQDYLVSLFQAIYDIRRRNILTVAGPVLNLLLLGVLVVALDLGVLGAILAYSVANGLVAAWSIGLVLRLLGRAPIRPARACMRQLVTYGLQSHLGLVFKELNYRGDTLLVSAFLGPAAVGLYSAAVNVAEMLWKLPEAVGIVLLPKVAQLEKRSAAAFAASVLRALVLPMLVSCGAVLLLGGHVVLFMFGQEFAGSVGPLLWLLPGVFAMAFWKIMANALVGLGKAMTYSVSSGVALILMLSLDLVCIPWLGLVGAAIASSVSYVGATVYLGYMFCTVTGLSPWELLRPRKGDLAVYRRLLNATGVFLVPASSRPAR